LDRQRKEVELAGGGGEEGREAREPCRQILGDKVHALVLSQD
jgi:hypothetical protein